MILIVFCTCSFDAAWLSLLPWSARYPAEETVTLEMAGYDLALINWRDATRLSSPWTAGSRWNPVPLNATKTDAKAPYPYMWSWIRPYWRYIGLFPMYIPIVRTIPLYQDVPPNGLRIYEDGGTNQHPAKD